MAGNDFSAEFFGGLLVSYKPIGIPICLFSDGSWMDDLLDYAKSTNSIPQTTKSTSNKPDNRIGAVYSSNNTHISAFDTAGIPRLPKARLSL
jgi:hypothetical protein